MTKIIKLEENQDQTEGLFLVNCWYCDKKTEFLPFKCKFCGNSFCADHRLPESHECAVEFKQGNSYGGDNKIPPKKIYAINSRGEVKDYRTRRPGRPQSRFSSQRQDFSRFTAAQILIILNISMLILNFILSFPTDFYFPLSLSIQNLSPPNFYYHTIITATIVPSIIGFFGIFGLIIFMIVVYWSAKAIEQSFGRSLALKIYFSGALITSASILLITTLFSLIPAYGYIIVLPFYSSSGGLIALITFRGIVHAEQRIRLYLYFFPINLSMRDLKWVFIGLEFIYGIIGGVYFIQNFSNILGAIGGIIFAGTVLRNQYSARRF